MILISRGMCTMQIFDRFGLLIPTRSQWNIFRDLDIMIPILLFCIMAMGKRSNTNIVHKMRTWEFSHNPLSEKKRFAMSINPNSQWYLRIKVYVTQVVHWSWIAALLLWMSRPNEALNHCCLIAVCHWRRSLNRGGPAPAFPELALPPGGEVPAPRTGFTVFGLRLFNGSLGFLCNDRLI